MTRNEVINDYFEWLSDIVCKNRFSKEVSYRKLLMLLHNIEFTYSMPMDDNRAQDGIDLRYRFSCDRNLPSAMTYLKGPCSVLEMMIALAIRCEETIMDDPERGNRTGQWFWGMISSLGLRTMIDDRIDKAFVLDRIEHFLNRDYEPNGEGGLFTIRHCNRDLRGVEIWGQLMLYLDSITGYAED